MALQDTAKLAVLSSLAPDAWHLLEHTTDGPEIGWDVLSAVFIRDYGSTAVNAAQILADWPIGRRPIQGLNFWTVKRTPQRVAGNIWKLSVTAHGSSTDRPLKHRVRSSVNVGSHQTITVGPPYYPQSATFAEVNIKEASPALEVSYILMGSTPPTDQLGIAGGANQTPPVIVETPPFIWSWLTQFSVNFPSGWSRDDIDADVLAGTDIPVSLITEVWNHKHFIQPK